MIVVDLICCNLSFQAILIPQAIFLNSASVKVSVFALLHQEQAQTIFPCTYPPFGFNWSTSKVTLFILFVNPLE